VIRYREGCIKAFIDLEAAVSAKTFILAYCAWLHHHFDYTGQQRFYPMRKMSVSDVFLDAEFRYVSRISLSPTPYTE
jgi:hypothetical protein